MQLKLGEVITLKRGYDLPNTKRISGDYPIVSSSGISDFHNVFKVKGPGVVTGRYGTIGQVYYVTNDFWPLNTTLYVEDFKDNNPRFISYFLKTLDFNSFAAKSAVPGINRNDLHLADVRIPDVFTQMKISRFLDAYDNLIENNNLRISILEEMAQRLYREWFVHFRFPGHENVKIVEAEHGKIPEGWRSGIVSDICDKIFSGGTPTTTVDEYWNGDLPWLSSGETRNSVIVTTEKTITEQGVFNSSTRKANKEDIVIASAGQGKTRGQTSLLLIDTYINQSVIALRGKPKYSEYLFINIKNRYDELRNASDSSSIRGSITTVLMGSLKIIIPDIITLKMFSGIVSQYIKEIGILTLKNIALMKTRDLLLPRLMSGDIDVSSINIPVLEVNS
jgi:type I restriction enzyme S subunit